MVQYDLSKCVWPRYLATWNYSAYRLTRIWPNVTAYYAGLILPAETWYIATRCYSLLV
ncbi:hypothetical protein BDV34DRAFT_194035 [Aspergillus parasiticus]|uniref:Uncharacterized protein n=1 Tax=Aspergillus parasiticus TaxID=5067 RepID=A0A5N6DM82_ASPPA|nr:hypothetical protein BDV34DRAFT_194035 [Aspergillus parasiticus]